MRSIQVFGKKVTGWQVLPADAKDFEEAALRACGLVLAGDPRIGNWSARLEIGGQAGGKIPEAGEATQDGRERVCEVVTNSVPVSGRRETLIGRHPLAAYFALTFAVSWSGALAVAAPI